MPKIVSELVREAIRKVKDPEIGLSVEKFISRVDVDEGNKSILVEWVPTTPFCPLVLAISAAIIYSIRKNLNLEGWSVKVQLDRSVPTAEFWNSQLADKDAVDKIISNLETSGQIKYFITE